MTPRPEVTFRPSTPMVVLAWSVLNRSDLDREQCCEALARLVLDAAEAGPAPALER